jgi:hypothetical protein
MRKVETLCGKVIGDWEVIREDGVVSGNRYYMCRCKCGREKSVRGAALRQGKSEKCKTCSGGRNNLRHGEARRDNYSLTYRSWTAMKRRCLVEKSHAYTQYGGRGIQLHPPWSEFKTFLNDMGACPPGMSIDRIDNNQDYIPGNCRWADQKTQMRNTRSNVIITYEGISQCVAAWAEHIGMNPGTLRERLVAGWGVKRSLTEPVGGVGK